MVDSVNLDSLTARDVQDGDTVAGINSLTEGPKRLNLGSAASKSVSEVVVTVTSVAEAQAPTGLVAGQSVNLVDGGRSGLFDVVAGDFTAEVAVDTFNGVHIAMADDPTGASKCLVRRLNGFVTPGMFGAAGDYDRSAKTGTSDELAIQHAINTAYTLGLEVKVNGDFGYSGIIVVPDNIKVSGIGSGLSGWFRLDANNTRGVIVGTYGPGNGPDSPAAGTYYSISAPVRGSKAVTTSVAADAANFSVGDIIGVEGSTPFYGTFKLPNMVTEVLSSNASTGVIELLDAIDDDYTGGRIVKLNDGTLSTNAIDSTGKTWPLLVSVNTEISDMSIFGTDNTGWAAVNLSTYKTKFRDVVFSARNALAGNPVAKTKFTDCYGYYTNVAYEFAYYSHDTDLSGCKFKRVGDYGGTNVVAGWANGGEGAKRINLLDKTEIDDTGSADTLNASVLTGRDSVVNDAIIRSDKTAIFGNAGAKLVNSNLRWGSGNGVTGFDDGLVHGNTVLSAVGVSSGYGIRQTSGYDVTEISGNRLLCEDGTRSQVDTIHLEDYAATEVTGNSTYANVRPYRRSYQSTVTESSSVAVAGELTMDAGTMQNGDIVSVSAILRGNIGDVVSVRINGTVVASKTLTTASRFKLSSALQYNGPGDTRCIYDFEIDESGAKQSIQGNFTSVSLTAVSSVDVAFTGMTTSSSILVESIDIIKTATRTF